MTDQRILRALALASALVGMAAGQTSFTLTSSPNPSTFGQSVTFTATSLVSPGAASASFLDGRTLIGTGTFVSINQEFVATFSTSALAVGTHSVTANYTNPSGVSSVSSNPVSQVVNQAATTTSLSASPNPSNFGQAVTLTARVAPANASGTVTFTAASTAPGAGTPVVLGNAAVANGVATVILSTLAAGHYNLGAAYSGDTNFLASSAAPVLQTVNQIAAAVTLSVTPVTATPGQIVNMTATVAPSTATGTVTFRDGSATIGTATLSGGTAAFSTATLAVGTHTITATYNGDANNAASTSAPVTVTVGQTATTTILTVSPLTSTPGQPVNMTVTVSPPTATGTVTFKDGGNPIGTAPLNGGTAIFSITTLAIGSHVLQASYSGDNTFSASSSTPVTMTVGPTPTSTVLSVVPVLITPGQTVALTAVVSPSAATGTVNFKDGASVIGTGTLNNGVATFSTTALATGPHTLTAVYSGDSNFAASTSAPVVVSVGLQSTTTSLAAAPNPGTFGQPVIVTATVVPAAATGSVTFLDGLATIGTGTLNGGTATLTTSSLAVGNHTLTATYAGDSKFATSTSSPLAETVNQAGTRTVLAVTPNPATFGQTVTLAAAVTPSTATGSVTFLDGTSSLGTAPLSGGSATFTTSSLAVGSHTLMASYQGDGGNAASTSLAVVETINPVSQPNPVTISSPGSPLPAGTVGVAYSQAFTATGGAAPYTFSVVSSTSTDLTMSAAGVLSGTPKTAGTFQFTVQVQDSATPPVSATAPFSLTVSFPALPAITLSVSAQPQSPADQPTPQLAFAQGYPLALTGTFALSFTPNAAGLPANFTNGALQFATGGSSVKVNLAAGATSPATLPAIQVGTVAGTINVTLTALAVTATGQTVPLPSPAPGVVITVPRIAPVITAGSVKITAVSATGFQVELNGSTTPRDLSSASVTFTAASGTQLNGTSFTVSLAGASGTWFASTNTAGVSAGGSFHLIMPFSYSGDTTALGTVSVTLTNSVGTSAAVSGGR